MVGKGRRHDTCSCCHKMSSKSTTASRPRSSLEKATNSHYAAFSPPNQATFTPPFIPFLWSSRIDPPSPRDTWLFCISRACDFFLHFLSYGNRGQHQASTDLGGHTCFSHTDGGRHERQPRASINFFTSA